MKNMKTFFAIALLLLVVFQLTDACFQQDNARKAAALNKKFKGIKLTDKCVDGTFGCIGGKFVKCAFKKWVSFDCPPTETCSFLPLVNKPGTTCTCDTPADIASRFKLARECRGKTG
ncbi:9563_t:CDS:2 [Paraglomus occultum]|uniref:9563_t:CDS:1 n=1 Tax=Paraglomus occultum TaxID=144539 RepID=A0A9N8VVN0_9GLOM|nr:9563_t:CDS:2 [Paraglomus occultum]